MRAASSDGHAAKAFVKPTMAASGAMTKKLSKRPRLMHAASGPDDVTESDA